MLLKNGIICDYRGERKADIRIEDGKIVEISESLGSYQGLNCIDCSNKLIAPSLIDLNVYPKSKTLSQKTLTSLSKKAIKGGVGTVLILPDTTPSCENEAILELIKSIANNIEINLICSIKPTNDEKKLNDIAILYSQGGRAIYIDSNIDGNNLLRIAQYSSMLNIPIICFPQDKELANGVINEGEFASKLGLPSISPLSQTKEIAKFSEVARYTQTSFLFSLVSELISFELIEYFKTKDSKIFNQTSIHHLILNENECEAYNTRVKINPPLKDVKTQQKLITFLKEGKINMLTTLQCADFNSKKDQVFELASFGIDSIGYYFQLVYTYFIDKGILTLKDFLKMASKNQSDFLSLNKGEISIGKDADLMIVDLDSSTQVQDSFSPYYNQNLKSKIDFMIINGKIYE